MDNIKGIYAASMSVLNENLTLNINKTIEHAEMVIDKGCHGAAIFGSTGQAQLIPISEKINSALDVLHKNVDYISEFRVIGGEPLMNKDWANVVNSISEKNSDAKIFIYTNGTISPKEEQLESLQGKNVNFLITLKVTRHIERSPVNRLKIGINTMLYEKNKGVRPIAMISEPTNTGWTVAPNCFAACLTELYAQHAKSPARSIGKKLIKALHYATTRSKHIRINPKK